MSKYADLIVSGLIILVIAIAIIGSIVGTIKKNKIRAEEKTREVDDVIIKHGVRYTPEATIVDKDAVDKLCKLLNLDYEKYGFEFYKTMKAVDGEDSRVYIKRLWCYWFLYDKVIKL